MEKIRFILIALSFICNGISSWGQKPSTDSNSTTANNSVTLVVFGTGNSESEAIKIALRSAIEQTYGTFISTNTLIVNDELTKDEIVSVSSGNIEKYSLISSEKQADGKISVKVKATVSIGRLIQFAQSKGATTELAGAAFAMNMKIRKLNKDNESRVLVHTLEELLKISEMNLFDYEIKTDEPQIVPNSPSLYGIPTKIIVKPNKNYTYLVNTFKTTLASLSLSPEEQKEYTKTNDKIYNYSERVDVEIDGYRTGGGCFFSGFEFCLRNSLEESTEIRLLLNTLKTNIWKSSMSFKISDNLGNYSVPIFINYVGNQFEEDVDLGCDYPIYTTKISFNTNIFGITSSEDSYNKNFLGGSICNIRNYCSLSLKKPLFYNKELNYSIDSKKGYIFNKCEKNVIFQGEYGHRSCLDLSRVPPKETQRRTTSSEVSFPLSIYLYYNENDIMNLNSITVSPINPSAFICRIINKSTDISF